ncbi:signal peptidase [Heyndrickxia shackletonii]|uniref:Signal peptidase I n=1 Tax=Heyndrickxia shackletonii TaxID=157838 RepID=A0A0Q3WZC1_9BACI|nr:signal peptidase I [Heyndrickxia shackletonii]KQL55235.1 signal peptidase [Heyndrickxia shackletonii]NEY98760.1 signal peptidase I [Heyndrickxia shackletonii]
MRDNVRKEIKSWGKSLLIALVIVFVIRSFLISPYIVKGASMEPTLHNNEKVIVNKWNFTGRFDRGEIVIIRGKEKNYVKRIIGLPGDKIVIKNDRLYINGVFCKEPYLSENRKLARQMGSRLTGDYGPITVPKNKYFVMGDNRLRSTDSRNGLGLIQKERIVGKGEIVFYPVSDFRSVQ